SSPISDSEVAPSGIVVQAERIDTVSKRALRMTKRSSRRAPSDRPRNPRALYGNAVRIPDSGRPFVRNPDAAQLLSEAAWAGCRRRSNLVARTRRRGAAG